MESDRLAYRHQRQLVTSIIHTAKLEYHTTQITYASGDQRQLFKNVVKVLHIDNDTLFPPCESFDTLATIFTDFFCEKISTIRPGLTHNANHVDGTVGKALPVCQLSVFEPATQVEISNLLQSSPVKSCEFDPFPTWLLRDNAHEVVPLLTAGISLSLRSGIVPARLKKGHVRPRLKKPGLDKSVLNNYRPVSNLPYLSQIMKRFVAARLSTHMSEHNLSEPYQSAHKPNHSVETALLCVQNDILKAMVNQTVTILVLLDLSAAFDTVDHKVLLRRLSQDVGVAHHALRWFIHG